MCNGEERVMQKYSAGNFQTGSKSTLNFRAELRLKSNNKILKNKSCLVVKFEKFEKFSEVRRPVHRDRSLFWPAVEILIAMPEPKS